MHFCPECGQACYCHGDIDDCVVETEEYSSTNCTHPRTAECGDDDAPWDDWDDDGDEDFHYFGPMPDPDDLALGPVVDLFCASCRRHTEHVVCESDGEATEYRCSQCFAWTRGVRAPVIFDPGLHQEMTEDPDGDYLLAARMAARRLEAWTGQRFHGATPISIHGAGR